MILDITEHNKYWDNNWATRLSGKNALGNVSKYRFILEEIYKRSYFSWMKIVEIGCGPGLMSYKIKKHWPNIDYTGVDISKDAVKSARANGLNAVCCDFLDLDDDGFDAVWFFDSLEHVIDLGAVAQKIVEITQHEFVLFGNIPMYLSQHELGYERFMDIGLIKRFVRDCGIDRFSYSIYESFNNPYMLLEATKGERTWTQ